MRTNIVIDNDLMKKAMKLGQFKTKRAVVEEGLRLLVLLKQQKAFRKLRGKLHWEGNLEQMRRDD
ncbi:MAG: type II toxin-antitoxin system VapB family antitoxin [Candidatus Marinimicrobia bacterium]|nr:type II toxin-antitoxin system VapB family antitoxin [Candidatus Neomarinimicrobiota bacterium]MBL7047868.1 type II toxin-antitoxin system VapB family antitoxin [Candidatus Neomarinimicrobiota bacterium]